MNETSIIEMARGGVIERVDMEMAKVLANIEDLNTDPKKARSITVKVTFKPDDYREKVVVTYEVDSKLAPKSPLSTSLTVGADGKSGKFYAV